MNKTGLVHSAIAEFLVGAVPDDRWVCVAYDLSDCGVAMKVCVLADEDDPPERWRCMPLTANTLSLNTVEVSGRGSAARDVMHLLSVVGVLRVSDYRPPKRLSADFLWADWTRRTPVGTWLSRRPHLLGRVLQAAVLLAVFKPWATPASMLWRLALRPAILMLGAFGGIQAVRDWLGV